MQQRIRLVHAKPFRLPSVPVLSGSVQTDVVRKTACGILPLWTVLLLAVLFLLPPLPAHSDTVKSSYIKADNLYREIKKSPSKRKYRSHWEKCAGQFLRAYKKNPEDGWAPASLYRAGEVYLSLYGVSRKAGDKARAIEIYQQVVSDFPKSRYKFRAATSLRKLGAPLVASPQTKTILASREKKPLPRKKPAGKPKASAEKKTQRVSSDTARIHAIRFKTYPNRTRIVVDASDEIRFAYNDLHQDKKSGKPPRVYVDFQKATLTKKVAESLSIADAQVKTLRVAQNAPDKVRLVIDIEKSDGFKIFSLFDPYRTVIDVWGKSKASGVKAPAVTAKLPPAILPKPGKISPGAIRKQLALGVHRIVIDPGHGGKDPGAVGYLKGVYEKNINLTLAKKLSIRLKKELGCEVLLTRKTDTFLTLDERTSFANKKHADLFISLHANSALSRRAYGIETYFLNLATDDEAIAVAARENATSTRNISDLQTILNDLMQNAKINESSRLASSIQKSMIAKLRKNYDHIKDKGVKQAPFYVLLGAEMPSVLIETAFISNPRECRRLKNSRYQDRICDAIVAGIKQYMADLAPKAVSMNGRHTTSG